MARSVMFCVEGVMSDDITDGGMYLPLNDGLFLFHGLAQAFHVILSSSRSDEDAVTRWLTYGLGLQKTEWARLLVAQEDEGSQATLTRHFSFLRSSGADLAYVVTPDPWFARYVLRAGVTPLLCPHPSYSRSSFLPDAGQGKASWEDIEAEVQAGRLIRKEDNRLEIDDIGGDGDPFHE